MDLKTSMEAACFIQTLQLKTGTTRAFSTLNYSYYYFLIFNLEQNAKCQSCTHECTLWLIFTPQNSLFVTSQHLYRRAYLAVHLKVYNPFSALVAESIAFSSGTTSAECTCVSMLLV